MIDTQTKLVKAKLAGKTITVYAYWCDDCECLDINTKPPTPTNSIECPHCAKKHGILYSCANDNPYEALQKLLKLKSGSIPVEIVVAVVGDDNA